MAGNQAISAPLQLATAASVTTAATSDSLTLSGPVAGPGGLGMAGPGLLVVSGNNSYSGGTTVSGGTLQLGSVTALGTGGLTVNGGLVDLHGNNLWPNQGSTLPSLQAPAARSPTPSTRASTGSM